MSRTLIVAGCVLLLAAGCARRDPDALVVARVEDRLITLGDFEATAASIEARYLPITADLEGKKELLDHMINKEVMSLKAHSMGYDKDKEFVDRWEESRGAFLIAALERMATRDNEPSDEEVAEYFERMHEEYTISQIVVAEEETALALRERFLAGEDFAWLAKTYSLGPGADQGGFIGSNTIGNIHWWVEEALFEMKPGDVSMPLRSTAGAVLIKMHSKRRVLPEQDEDYARRRLKAIMDRKSMENIKAQIEKDIGLKFFTDAVNVAFDALPDPDVPFEDIISYKITRANAPKLRLDPRHRDMLICQYADGSYTLADFERIYEETSLPQRPRRQYGKEHIIQTLHMQVFDKVLPAYAEKIARVLDDPEVRRRYDARFDRLMVTRLYVDQIRNEVLVTEPDIREFYAQNQDELAVPEQRDFSLLLAGDEDTARRIHRQAAEEDFYLLVRRYSLDTEFKDALGRTGLHHKGAMPELDEAAFALPAVGAISEPFETSRGWAIVKLEEIRESRAPSLEEVRDRIRKHLTDSRMEEIFQEKVTRWRAEFTVEINEKNLAKARLTRTRI